MRSADLKRLRPFADAIAAVAASQRADYGRCGCEIVDGRWALRGPCLPENRRRGGDFPCRYVFAAATRSYLAMVRLKVDHLDDVELARAVTDLHALTLDLPHTTVADFQIRVHEALRVPMAQPEAQQ